MRPARARVLEVIRRAGRPVGVEDIAAAVGLQPNAVRHHLSGLEAGGLIAVSVGHAGQRGRPRKVFEPKAPAPGPYELLALALLRARRTGETPVAAGRAVAPDGTDVVAFLTGEGFEPQPEEDGGVRLAACPLAAGAEADPVTVCGVHRGIVAAIAARRGESVDLVVGRPGTCRVVPAAGEIS